MRIEINLQNPQKLKPAKFSWYTVGTCNCRSPLERGRVIAYRSLVTFMQYGLLLLLLVQRVEYFSRGKKRLPEIDFTLAI